MLYFETIIEKKSSKNDVLKLLSITTIIIINPKKKIKYFSMSDNEKEDVLLGATMKLQ